MANSYSLVVLVAVFRTEVAIELLLISGSNTLMIYFFGPDLGFGSAYIGEAFLLKIVA